MPNMLAATQRLKWRKSASVTTPPEMVARKHAPKAKWEPYKERILNMRRQNAKLKDIIVILEKEGFHATESQYKKRLKYWGSRKYSKSKVERHCRPEQSPRNPANRSDLPNSPEGDKVRKNSEIEIGSRRLHDIDLTSLFELLGISGDFQYNSAYSGNSTPLGFNEWNKTMESKMARQRLEHERRSSPNSSRQISSAFQALSNENLCDFQKSILNAMKLTLREMADENLDFEDFDTMVLRSALDTVSSSHDQLYGHELYPFFNESKESTPERFIQLAYRTACLAWNQGRDQDYFEFLKVTLRTCQRQLGTDHAWSMRILFELSLFYVNYVLEYQIDMGDENKVIPVSNIRRNLRDIKRYPADIFGSKTFKTRSKHLHLAKSLLKGFYGLEHLAICAARASLLKDEEKICADISDYAHDWVTLEGLQILFMLPAGEGDLDYQKLRLQDRASQEILKYLWRDGFTHLSSDEIETIARWMECLAAIKHYMGDSVRSSEILVIFKEFRSRLLAESGEIESDYMLALEHYNLMARGCHEDVEELLFSSLERAKKEDRFSQYLYFFHLGQLAFKQGLLDRCLIWMQFSLDGFIKGNTQDDSIATQALETIVMVLQKQGLPLYARPISHYLLKLHEAMYGPMNHRTIRSSIQAMQLSLECNEDLRRVNIRAAQLIE